MSCISICNYGPEKVGVCNVASIGSRCCDAFLTLFPVVEELCHKKSLNLFWDGILMLIRVLILTGCGNVTCHRIVCKVWRGFVSGGSCGRALPARNVDRIKILCHLSKHCRVKAAICEAGITILLLVSTKNEMLYGSLRTLNLPSTICHSFLLWLLLGYCTFKFPLLATICSAMKGRLVYLHLESVHHSLTAFTSSW